MVVLCLGLGCRCYTPKDFILESMKYSPSTLFLGSIWCDGRIYCITDKEFLIATYESTKNASDSFYYSNVPPGGFTSSIQNQYEYVDIFTIDGRISGFCKKFTEIGKALGTKYLQRIVQMIRSAPSAPMSYTKLNSLERTSTFSYDETSIALWLNWHFQLRLDKELSYYTSGDHCNPVYMASQPKYLAIKRDALKGSK